MIKLINTTGGSLTANSNIPLNLKYNTNGNTSFKNNVISINKPGYYEINASFVITATTTGSSSVQVYADGIAINEAINTQTVATGDTYSYILNDVEKVKISLSTSDTAEISFVPSVAGTLVSANVSIVEIR